MTMHDGFTQAGSIEPPSGGGSRLNPWFSAWTRPRETIRQILDTDPDRYVLRLAAAGGIARMFDLAESRSLGDHFPFPVVLAGIVVLGALAGVASLYFYAWALERTSTWIPVHISMKACRTAVAWPNVLTVWAFIPLAVNVLILGPDCFTSATPRLDAYPILFLPYLGLVVIGLAVKIWTLVVFVRMLGAVEDVSGWKALGHTLLADLFAGIWVVAAVLLYHMLRSCA